MTDPEESKLRAEAQFFEAQALKLRRELEPPSLSARIKGSMVDATKVVGSVVLGIGGFVTAFTGYQLTEARKERVEAEIVKREIDLAKLDDKYQESQASQEAKLAEARKQLDDLVIQLKTLKPNEISAAPAPESVQKAINKATALDNSLQTAEKEGRESKAELNRAVQRLRAPLKY